MIDIITLLVLLYKHPPTACASCRFAVKSDFYHVNVRITVVIFQMNTYWTEAAQLYLILHQSFSSKISASQI